MDDMQQIEQLKARYCRTMDTKDWSGMRGVMADDVAVDTTDSGGTVMSGADEFIASLRQLLEDVVTVHHCHMPEITLQSRSSASGVWAMEDMLWFPDGTHLHGYGHYHETYEKREGRWLITSCRLSRIRMDVGPSST